LSGEPTTEATTDGNQTVAATKDANTEIATTDPTIDAGSTDETAGLPSAPPLTDVVAAPPPMLYEVETAMWMMLATSLDACVPVLTMSLDAWCTDARHVIDA
jgi:hypothetical protein